MVLGNLGSAYWSLGQVKEAIGYYEQALGITREIGDRRGEGNSLGNLGNAYADLGQVEKAIGYYEQALGIDREIGDRRGEGAVLGNLGLAYADLGQAEKAIGYHEQPRADHLKDRRPLPDRPRFAEIAREHTLDPGRILLWQWAIQPQHQVQALNIAERQRLGGRVALSHLSQPAVIRTAGQGMHDKKDGAGGYNQQANRIKDAPNKNSSPFTPLPKCFQALNGNTASNVQAINKAALKPKAQACRWRPAARA